VAYLVNITARAQRDLALLFDRINAEHSARALKWYRGLTDSIVSLRASPNRCPTTPEKSHLRHMLYGNKPHIYRVIYEVLEKRKEVNVLHIRHGARTRFQALALNK